MRIRLGRASVASGVAATAIAGIMVVAAPPAAASGYCRTPYFSGHVAYMTCIGTGNAAFTIRCSSFGLPWYLGGHGDFAMTRGGGVYGSRTFTADCGWGSWPAQVKGYTTDIS